MSCGPSLARYRGFLRFWLLPSWNNSSKNQRVLHVFQEKIASNLFCDLYDWDVF